MSGATISYDRVGKSIKYKKILAFVKNKTYYILYKERRLTIFQREQEIAMVPKLFGLALVLAVAVIFPILAPHTNASGKVVDRTLEGRLVCMDGELKNDGYVRAARKTYGHEHVLKIADGWYIKILENRYSADLIKSDHYHDKDIVIHGQFHTDANLLEVEFYTVDGRQMTWCDHCRAMDSCGAMKK